MTAFGELQDDFNDNSVDPVKWPNTFGTVQESGGFARVEASTGFSAYASAAAYSLTDSFAGVFVSPPASGGASLEAYAQLVISPPVTGTDALVSVNSATDEISFLLRSGGSDPAPVSVPYNPVLHAWVRIRESGGTLLWETSQDGFVWNEQRSEMTSPWVTGSSLRVDLLAHRDAGITDFALFDNFNIFPGCPEGAQYTVAIDWENDGSFTDPDDDITDDVLGTGVVVAYGRDSARQLSPPAVGRASFSLCNVSREFSPENSSSPLFGNLDAARPVEIKTAFEGTEYFIHTGRIDDFTVHVDRGDRTVDFTTLDGLSILQGSRLSTELLPGLRTGEIVHKILDNVGWTGPRDIDPGATHVPWWWSEDNAFDALQEILRSEGPPAVAFVAPDGTFTYKDRHHRILDDSALVPQAAFSAALIECDAPAVTGLDYTAPFVYEHGWRDIINSVTISVEERVPDPGFSVIWSTNSIIVIENGETVTVDVEANEPFIDLQTLVPGVDAIWNFAVTLSAAQFRRSGQSVQIDITASGGTATITYFQVRGRSVPVARTTKITVEDSVSIAAHGKRTFPSDVPWVNTHDALAVASLIIAHFSERRPMVEMRVVAQDPQHLIQILSRSISDRITIRNDELGLDSDFHIENISHTIRRIDPEHLPVHSVVFGCEKVLADSGLNPFTFDKAGAGFDDGTFGLSGIDDPGTVFIFDHPVQGQFDTGLFGT